MARIRSPNYPQISLPEAVRRVELIRSKEGRNAASREVLAKLLGFSGLNGASMSILSAISKYGLVEDAGDKELKVSDLADAIMFPNAADEKADGLWEAANKPVLFYEINQKWPEHPPSDENLRSYLMRRGFSQGALDNAISCYRETMALVTSGEAGYDSGANQIVEEASRSMSRRPAHSPLPPRHRAPIEGNAAEAFNPSSSALATPPGQEPFRVSFMPGGIEVSGRLNTSERADELIRAIEALKALLPRADISAQPNRSHEKVTDDPRSRGSVSLMITQEQKAALRDQGYTDEQIREMKPEDAHRALGLIN